MTEAPVHRQQEQSHMVVCGHRGVFPIVGRERARPPLLSKRHGRPQRRHPPRMRGGIPADRDRWVRVLRWGDWRLFGSPCVYGHVLKTRRNDRVVRVERRRRIGTAGRLKAALWESEDSETLHTSFVERLNLMIRQGSAYLRRRSPCHARGADQLHGHVDLLRCSYNVIRPHRALQFGRETRTPAMQAGLVNAPMNWSDIFTAPAALYAFHVTVVRVPGAVQRLLVDGELYFASSTELNDPFECAIAPSFAASEDQILEYARDWVERQGQDPAGREAEVRQLVARASTEDFQKETERRYVDVTQSYGIASVTTTATNPLMWSYYAAAHTGIVVGIDTMRLMQQPFRAPMFPLDVEYAMDFPVANFYTDDDFDIVRKTLGTKSYDWHHEEEWRWILIGESGIVRVDPGVIRTIVFGLRTDGDTE